MAFESHDSLIEVDVFLTVSFLDKLRARPLDLFFFVLTFFNFCKLGNLSYLSSITFSLDLLSLLLRKQIVVTVMKFLRV